MHKSEYRAQLQSILLAASLIQLIKIADVLQAMNHAETIAPILDPTLYLNAATSLEWQKRIVEAALQFQQAIKETVSDPRYSQHTGEKQ